MPLYFHHHLRGNNMAPRKKTEGVTNADDLLSAALAKSINQDENAHAYFLGEEDTPTDLSMWVSTGCSELDAKISNRADGGLAFGRIYEIAGLEGSGKSLLCAHIMANVQKAGGLAVLIDTENAVNVDFFNAVGVSLDSPHGLYVQTTPIESVFNTVVKVIETVRKSDRDRKVVIVVDSVAGASSESELEADFTAKGYNTEKSRIIGQAMRKLTGLVGDNRIMLIFTNQLRMKMNPMPFGDQYVTPGGMAIPFTASVRLRLVKAEKIKDKNKNVIGLYVKVEIVKNRLGPPYRKAEFAVFFDRGIDDSTSMFNYLKGNDIIKGNVKSSAFVDQHGEEHTFSLIEFGKLKETKPELHREMYEAMCNTIIQSYKSKGLTTESDEVELDDSSDD